MKVVGIGACVLDTYIVTDSYPIEDSKQKALRSFKMGGGPTSNALVTIAKLGGEASFLGALSNDDDGKKLVEEFKKYNVGTQNIKILDGFSSFTSYIVVNSKDSTRTVVFDKGNIPDEAGFVNLDAIREADVLHLDGNNLNQALEASKYAKKCGVLVSLDAGSVYPNIELLLPYVDILITSADFAVKFTNTDDLEDAIKKLNERYHPLVLAVTNGKNGGLYVKEGKIEKYEAYFIDAVDTNGSGDTFHGGFIYAFLKTRDITYSLKFAAALVAIRCKTFGVRNALPTYDEVINFIKEN